MFPFSTFKILRIGYPQDKFGKSRLHIGYTGDLNRRTEYAAPKGSMYKMCTFDHIF